VCVCASVLLVIRLASDGCICAHLESMSHLAQMPVPGGGPTAPPSRSLDAAAEAACHLKRCRRF